MQEKIDTTVIEVSRPMEVYAEQARIAGLPLDQVQNFLLGGYVALDGMLPFHAAAREADKTDGPEWIAMGGKRGPGKSHTAMAQVGLDDCQRFPGLKVLFLRKLKVAAKESLEDLIANVFRYTNHDFVSNRVNFPNGSRILIGGFKDEKDIEKYLGVEYDIIVLEEATQISETKKDKLRGSLRSSKPGWRPRIYLTTNADGVGLMWFKKMFVEAERNGVERETKVRFFDITHVDNPHINQEYTDWLNGLTGALGKAWRLGDWDAFAGMAFPQWNYEQHVIQPFDIPENWPKWNGMDWGSAAPWCYLWVTQDPDTRRIYVYREAYAPGLTTSQQCDRVHMMSPAVEHYLFSFADPAVWAKQNRKDEVFTIAQEYQENGIKLTKADNDRLNGKRKIDDLLAPAADGQPGIQIFDTCPHLIEQLSSLVFDERNPEDVDTDQEDHAYDTLRYACTNIKRVVRKPPKPKSNPMSGVKGL